MLPNLLTPLPRETLKHLQEQREGGGGCGGDRRERWVATGMAIFAMLAGAAFAVIAAF